ncbi:DUF3634 family protein [Vibrio sp. HDW18]|uniref:DUF3634 family protein n=1 Tax=Vibrio sp. HDW18 TaxID=2714948 RepID=UPI00140C9F6D|nr:DUF3634 family protein [Vibrio sp. HDW18]QIL84464.1 DUF3634 family protein [Vibrio sp. HDW18]
MLYVILVAAIIIFWLVALDRPVLVVNIKDGQLINSKGHLPPTFKHNLLDIAQHEPFSGRLKVYRQRTGAKLTFSKSVPRKIQQRIRNVFPHQGFASSNSMLKKGR